jgi:hypothetical protein
MNSTTDAKKRRRKRNKKKADGYRSYVFEITDWELSYSFSVNWNEKLIEGPCFESMSLEIKGLILLPEKHASRGIHASFLGDRRIPPDPRDSELSNWKPRCVGTITLRGETREFLGSLPFDSLPILIGLLETKRIKYVDLHGKAPSYGSAEIRSIHFLQKYNPEEYQDALG